MTIAELIPMAINLSMALLVLALGLQATWADATSLFRQPSLLLRSMVSMNVVMPILAILMALVFNLHPAAKIALVALALSPVPPVLPGKQRKAGGGTSYVAGLLVTMAILSILIVPLGIWLINQPLQLQTSVPAGKIISIVVTGILVPLLAGLLVRQFAPAVAERAARPLSLFATVLLVVAFIPVLIKIWPSMSDMVGNGTLVALAVFTIVGVAIGHTLGGPIADNRTALALATGTRHPGVAMAIASATFPEEKAVVAVVIWHLLVGAIVCVPYVKWRSRLHAISGTEAS
ncbi:MULTISPECIES: bile acid:sodium symporter family protein [Mesorhizobium]|jgi:bile acid:Na+ symporter, BASS family|uniref:Uncharacterized protein n=1 Tax=Rhizobium loti TaxID=381 RepID=A0A6M7TW03_RHILI|nr:MULTISPECIES: hypothetical protein [Mesorhizobium]KRB25741.1 hypothetical protein ASE05_07050 [Mesorhizobium sp. Root172]OBQ65072.1 hypothetical protein A8145_12700 [Mesorhizobium loti]QKC68188.1 Na+-dependent transporter [Mesorhizobium loti]QKC87501.1 Na+-dependent transporter [Mesorhizobium sp. NZP2234]